MRQIILLIDTAQFACRKAETADRWQGVWGLGVSTSQSWNMNARNSPKLLNCFVISIIRSSTISQGGYLGFDGAYWPGYMDGISAGTTRWLNILNLPLYCFPPWLVPWFMLCGSEGTGWFKRQYCSWPTRWQDTLRVWKERGPRPLKSTHTRGFRGVKKWIECIEHKRTGFDEVGNVETCVKTVIVVGREETVRECDTLWVISVQNRTN